MAELRIGSEHAEPAAPATAAAALVLAEAQAAGAEGRRDVGEALLRLPQFALQATSDPLQLSGAHFGSLQLIGQRFEFGLPFFGCGAAGDRCALASRGHHLHQPGELRVLLHHVAEKGVRVRSAE